MGRRALLLAGLVACVPAHRLQAHRLDEYLQAALISLEPDSVEVELNLTPGVAVFGTVIPRIDIDGNGVISSAEQQLYASRVLSDLSLVVDQSPQVLELVSFRFPPVEEMREGLGIIRLDLRARIEELQPGPHELRFENRHRPEIGAYLANALIPPKSITIARQSRDERQTQICIDYWVGAAENERSVDGRVLLGALLCAAAVAGLVIKWVAG